MHLKLLFCVVVFIVFIHEIDGIWARFGGRRSSGGGMSSRRRSWSSSRRRIISSSRRRFISSSRRRFISTSRRRSSLSTRRRFISASRRRFISTSRRRSSWTTRRRFISASRRRFISTSRRRSSWTTRRRSISASRRRSMRWWSSSRGKSTKSFAHTVKTKSGLNTIYNTKIVSVQRVHRPLQGFLGKLGITHSGVVVTTANGRKWLVHKGKAFGKSSQTVVVDPKYMSNKWKYGKPHSVKGATVGQFIKAGGKHYNWMVNNCHHATKRMCKIKG